MEKSMSKYKQIDEIKEKIEELNLLLKVAQESNFVLRINANNLFDQEKQVNVLQIVLSEAVYSERII